jgi:long-chain acyl-CoA synthetase
MYQAVPPAAARPWRIDLGMARQFLRDQPLQLRVKFNSAVKSPSGTFDALPPGSSLPRAADLEVRFGQPIPVAELRSRIAGLARSEGYKAATQVIEDAVRTLRESARGAERPPRVDADQIPAGYSSQIESESNPDPTSTSGVDVGIGRDENAATAEISRPFVPSVAPPQAARSRGRDNHPRRPAQGRP